MGGAASKRSSPDNISDLWMRPREPRRRTGELVYRPAALVECTVNFRSLRAGLNHSEDRTYSAWVPEGTLAIDWDTPAADFGEGFQVDKQADPEIPYRQGDYRASREDFEEYQQELTDRLTRGERLRVFFNSAFGLFAGPTDPLDRFLARVAEAALGRVEPELKRLRARFELQIEQIREAHSERELRAEILSLDKIISQNLQFLESTNRLASMFSTLAGSVFGTPSPRPQPEPGESSELREDLERVEQEASEALQALYSEYLSLANEYDIFEIGVQPQNIQVTRRSVLWVPVPGDPGPPLGDDATDKPENPPRTKSGRTRRGRKV